MGKKRKQNNSNHIGKKICGIVIGMLVVFIVCFEAYRMISSYLIKRSSDANWPTHDLTSGQYSGSLAVMEGYLVSGIGWI